MSKYEIGWHTEGHIVVVTMHETVLPEEYTAMDEAFMQYVNEAKGALVHFVYSMSDEIVASELSHMTDLQFAKHPAMGWSIMIGEMNPITRVMITLAAKINRARFKMVGSVDEAIDFLYTVDANLPSRESVRD